MNRVITINKPLNIKWFVLLMLVCLNGVFAKKIKDLNENWSIAMSVKYNKISKSYTIESRTIGEVQYKIKENAVVLRQIVNGHVTVKLQTYPEFVDQIKPINYDLKYLNALSAEIEKYINYLELKPFDLAFNLIILPENYGLLYSEKIKPRSLQPVELTFIATLPKGQNGIEMLGLKVVSLLPHELFHFLANYENLDRMNLLRNETYAHIFGECVAYEVNPVINDGMVLTFPDYFYRDTDEDFIKVKSEMKKDAFVRDSMFPKSLLGRSLARYYFQAVANNYTGQNISSDKIPKFCHKLFSEHNFKHPIEKKPPPWFKEFLSN